MGHLAPAALDAAPPAIVLAAGAATRMGRLKQLLPFRGETLLRHAIAQIREAGFHRIVVVLGAQSETVAASLAGLSLELVTNPQWPAGMGSSLGVGLQQALATEEPLGVAVLLGDQPLVRAAHLQKMRELFAGDPERVVAAEYSGRLGVPAFFGRMWFDALRALPPDAGAAKLLNSGIPVTRFPLPEAAFDLDTPADLEKLSALL
jgi:molybdenum cofactor cytidylyltransferase